ncbi:flagellar motor switch phosphatase FliY [Anoxynatronum sibiricum]|uniref:Flagellar motor switch phosphatase FliY n=1 Tax=Anoxynatronum sibiricum TaxID=210623 RepID=A0ABU9VQI2_9CLOT
MSDMLSQEEIDALLSGGDSSDDEPSSDAAAAEEEIYFSEQAKDTIGEIGNISMGTAATTLSTLLNNKVVITTPRVALMSLKNLSKEYPLPFVGVEVRYKEGIKGTNLMVLKESDVKIITNLMMGQSPEATDDPISDLHLSAIAEAMNQMVGSSSTSLSEMFMKKIDISPPKAFQLDLQTPNLNQHVSDMDETFVRIAFKMEVGDLIDSEIMQLIPIDFANEMVQTLMPESGGSEAQTATAPQPIPAVNDDFMMDFDEAPLPATPTMQSPATPQMQSAPPPIAQPQPNVNVQPAQFQSFDDTASGTTIPENIALIQDVPLKVTVELGRTVKRVSEVLEFGPGTIVELDRIVGEPLDILVNGQYVAKGEVVVIDENYGIRVTDIVNPNKRFSKI